MNDNVIRGLDILDLITVISLFLQVESLQGIQTQVSNDDILKELHNQDRNYLRKILENQKRILDELQELKSGQIV